MGADFLVSFPGLGIENLELNRVAFSIFGLDVYWYGLLIALAAILSLILATRDGKKYNFSEDYILDSILVILVSMIIGARLYYVIFSWDNYKDNLLSIFDLRTGGLAFYGGVIGSLFGLIIYHKIKKLKISKYLDFIVVYVPLAQAIGRLGNFVNQEAFGTNTDLPWGMISNGTRDYLSRHPELGQNPELPVHPTFAYEAISNIILFFILYQVRKRSKRPLETTAAYIIGYGIIRFFVEGLRTDSLYIAQTDIRVSQALSLVMVILGIAYLFYIRTRAIKEREEAEDLIFETKVSGEETNLDKISSEENEQDGEILEESLEDLSETSSDERIEETLNTEVSESIEEKNEFPEDAVEKQQDEEVEIISDDKEKSVDFSDE